MKRTIPGPTVAAALGIPEHVLRDRQRAFGPHLGARIGRTRMFALEELGELSIAEFLHRYGILLPVAFRVARENRVSIHAAVNALADDRPEPFLLVAINDCDDIDSGVSTFANVDTRTYDYAAVLGLNLRKIIARTLALLPVEASAA